MKDKHHDHTGSSRTHTFVSFVKSGLSRLSTLLSYEREAGIDPRLDMERRLMLPRWLLDWFTGKPILDGKSRPTALDPIAYLGLDIGIALLGVIEIVAVMAYLPLALQIML